MHLSDQQLEELGVDLQLASEIVRTCENTNFRDDSDYSNSITKVIRRMNVSHKGTKQDLLRVKNIVQKILSDPAKLPMHTDSLRIPQNTFESIEIKLVFKSNLCQTYCKK